MSRREVPYHRSCSCIQRGVIFLAKNAYITYQTREADFVVVRSTVRIRQVASEKRQKWLLPSALEMFPVLFLASETGCARRHETTLIDAPLSGGNHTRYIFMIFPRRNQVSEEMTVSVAVTVTMHAT